MLRVRVSHLLQLLDQKGGSGLPSRVRSLR
jgi:hypothetical protein